MAIFFYVKKAQLKSNFVQTFIGWNKSLIYLEIYYVNLISSNQECELNIYNLTKPFLLLVEQLVLLPKNDLVFKIIDKNN